jgi:hypothetical protein
MFSGNRTPTFPIGEVAYNEGTEKAETMPRFKPKGMLERSAVADLWKHTLSRIPTAYGRLEYLASLRDANSGVYRHHGLAAAFGRDESVRALRESHEQTFLDWQILSMPEKMGDLREYLLSLEEPSGQVLDYRTHSGLDPRQLPASAREADRALFGQELRMLLEMLRNEFAGAPRAQG